MPTFSLRRILFRNLVKVERITQIGILEFDLPISLLLESEPSGFIQPTPDDVGFLREKLRRDTTPNIMSSALEAEIIESVPEINLETYVETRAKLP